MTPIAGGHLEHENWDHRPIWCDFAEVLMFGHDETKTPPMHGRKLKLINGEATKKCIRILKHLCVQHNAWARLNELLERLKNTGDNSTVEHELNQLDNEQMTCMKKAETKCRKYEAGKVAFSPSVGALGAGIRFLTMALGWKRGRKTSSRKLEELQKKSELTGLVWKTYSIERLLSLIHI